VQCATKTGARLLGITDIGVLIPGMADSWIAVKSSQLTLAENLCDIFNGKNL
jgi:hypothetical protein